MWHFLNTVLLLSGCSGAVCSPPRHDFSDWNGTDKDAILQQDAEDEEHKVQYKHGEAQHSAHLPATGGNGHDDKEEHEEEQHDGAEQAVGADGYRLAVVEQSVHEPRDRQTKTRGQMCFCYLYSEYDWTTYHNV